MPKVRFDCRQLLCSHRLNTKTGLQAVCIDPFDWRVDGIAYAHATPPLSVVFAEWKFPFYCHQPVSPLSDKKIETKSLDFTQLRRTIVVILTLICFEIGKVPNKLADEPASSAQNIKCLEMFGEQFALIFLGPHECRQLWMWMWIRVSWNVRI